MKRNNASHGGSIDIQWIQESIEFLTNGWVALFKHNHWELVSTKIFPAKDKQCMRKYSLKLNLWKWRIKYYKYVKEKLLWKDFQAITISSENLVLLTTTSKPYPIYAQNINSPRYAIKLAPIYHYHHQLLHGNILPFSNITRHHSRYLSSNKFVYIYNTCNYFKQVHQYIIFLKMTNNIRS